MAGLSFALIESQSSNFFGGSQSNISFYIKITRQNRKHFQQQEQLHYKKRMAAAVYSPTPSTLINNYRN
jgi:hypothetical protein